MAAKQHTQKAIQVCAHWQGMDEPVLMETLYATPSRGAEVLLRISALARNGQTKLLGKSYQW